MQFIDEAEVYLKAGDGGAGAVAFRREKFVPRGGPAGGDGGNGADIILETDERLTTLLDFRFKREYRARNGEPGRGRDQNGHAAPELILKVPPGTLVRDVATGGVVADLRDNGARYVLAKGGRGGLGNMNFATPTLQAPRFAQPGTPGEEKRVKLELRLLADVGLVGFPNAGKSTLVARVSRARPKIADYPFTTLQPHLGVVQYKDQRSFVLTDLPGLIEGAAEGAGLGHRFLKHMQRCRVVVHLVDASSAPLAGRELVADFDAINRELTLFDPALGRKTQIVAANKVDLPDAQEAALHFAEALQKRGIEVHLISGATGEGLPALLDAIVLALDAAGAPTPLERDAHVHVAPSREPEAAAPVAQPADVEGTPQYLTDEDFVDEKSPAAASGAAAAVASPAPAGRPDALEPAAQKATRESRTARRKPVGRETVAEKARREYEAVVDEREEAKREKAARAPRLTGRRKDGVFKSKAVEMEAKGTRPHKSRAAQTSAAVKALAAVAPAKKKVASATKSALPARSAPAPTPAPVAAPAPRTGAKAAAAKKPASRSPGDALAQLARDKRARKGTAHLEKGKRK